MSGKQKQREPVSDKNVVIRAFGAEHRLGPVSALRGKTINDLIVEHDIVGQEQWDLLEVVDRVSSPTATRTTSGRAPNFQRSETMETVEDELRDEQLDTIILDLTVPALGGPAAHGRLS